MLLSKKDLIKGTQVGSRTKFERSLLSHKLRCTITVCTSSSSVDLTEQISSSSANEESCVCCEKTQKLPKLCG